MFFFQFAERSIAEFFLFACCCVTRMGEERFFRRALERIPDGGDQLFRRQNKDISGNIKSFWLEVSNGDSGKL